MLTRLVDLLLYTMTKTSQAVKKISGFEKNITRFFAYSFLSVPAGLPRCTEITVLPGDDVRVAKKKKKSDLLGWCLAPSGLLGPSVLRRLSLVLRSRGERWRS